MMAEIEKGEYFVVRRGFRLGKALSFFAERREAWQQSAEDEDEPRFDRSYEGLLYLALEVCGPMVAAVCVQGDKYGTSHVGERTAFNTDEVELWPVSQAYVAALVQKTRSQSE